MSKKTKEEEELDEFIMRGIQITHAAFEDNIFSTHRDELVDEIYTVFHSYQNWRMDVANFFIKYNLKNECSFFLEADEVPLIVIGLSYFDIDHPDFQKLNRKLIQNIRTATKTKLAFLRDFNVKLAVANETVKKQIASEEKRVLEKDKNGDFLYDGRKILLPQEAIYYQVLDALYLHADQDGFASYETIDKYLVKCGRPAEADQNRRIKRIRNALSKGQGLFKYAFAKRKKIDGKKLIEIIRGKGLQLNNPKV